MSFAGKSTNRSVRTTVFVVLLLALLVQAAYLMFYLRWSQERRIEDEAQSKLIFTLSRLQGTLEYLFRQNDLVQIREEIAVLGTEDGISSAFIVDADMTVLASLRYKDVGSSYAGAVDDWHEADVVRLQSLLGESLIGKVWLSDYTARIIGVFPILIPGLAAQANASAAGSGYLVLRYDLMESKGEVLGLIIQEMGYQVLLVLIAALMIHFLVTRRIQLLRAATENIAMNDFLYQIDIRGQDEIADLGRSMNAMADRIQKDQKQLKSHASRMEAILNATAEGIAGFDANGNCLFANDALRDILGLEKQQQLTGWSVNDILHTENQQNISSLLQGMRNHSGADDNTYLCVKGRAGANIDIELYCYPLDDPEGGQGYVVTFNDITERKKIANDIMIKNYAIETSVNAFMFSDLDGRVKYVNSAFLDMWGFAEMAAVFDRRAEEFYGVAGSADIVRSALEDKGHWLGEVALTANDGSVSHSQLAVSMIRDEHGKPLFVMSSFVDISELKNMQAALGRSEETYAKAEAIAHIGSWDWDIITGALHWTDEIYRIFGQEPQSFGATYDAFLQTIHDDDRQRVIDAVNAAVADEKVEYNIEHRIVRLNTGEQRTVQERGKVYRDDDGKPLRMIGTVYDITEQKRFERALHEERNFVTAILDSAGALVVVLDKLGRIERFNRACAETTGFAALEVLGGYVWDYFIVDEQKESVKNQFTELRHQELRGEYENYWLTKEGERRLISWSNSVLKSPEGEVEHIISVGKDITEQRQAENALNQAAIRLKALMSYAPVVMFALGEGGEFYLSEGKGLERLGLEAGQMVGENVYQAYKDYPQVLDDIGRALEGERFTSLREVGNTVFETFYSPVNSEAFGGVRTIGVSVDITERFRAEQELAKHRENLEEMVAARTAALKEAQNELVKKERLATLGQLTATVSHELRNPLGAMQPSLYVIRKKLIQDDEQLQVAVQRLERNIARCDRIIDELLDFTRITVLERQPTAIVEWLDSCISDVSIPKEITLERDYRIADVEFNVDSSRLRRALINVLENACHAIQEHSTGSGRVKVILDREEGKLLMRIQDNGVGMTPEVQARIFEPLYSTKGFGVGLGMPTVKQIMEQHEGGIFVDSVEGEGATVTLWLPWQGPEPE